MTNRKEVVEYMKQNRIAIIFNAPSGFEVDLYKDNEFIETRKIHKHNEHYARDLASNWINKLIKGG
jgi:hypothetical protein